MHEEFFELLKTDHDEIRDTLEMLSQISGKASRSKKALVDRLTQQLFSHMEAEEKAFYPALAQEDDSYEDALRAIEEHRIIRETLQDLLKLPEEHEHWSARLSVLKDIIEHHIEEEESLLFDDTREVLGEEQVEEIMNRYRQEKQQLRAAA
jgi:hemerythrin-like domain-containing protein